MMTKKKLRSVERLGFSDKYIWKKSVISQLLEEPTASHYL